MDSMNVETIEGRYADTATLTESSTNTGDSPEMRVAYSAVELQLKSSPRTGILEGLALGRSIVTGVLPKGPQQA